MTSRVNRLAANRVSTTLSGLVKTSAEVKTRQTLAPQNVLTFVTQNTGSYDYSYSVTPGEAGPTLTVTFTADVQNFPIANLTFRVYNGSPSNEVHPGDLTNYNYPTVSVVPFDPSAPKVHQWRVGTGYAGAAATFYMKFVVVATDQGALGI